MVISNHGKGSEASIGAGSAGRLQFQRTLKVANGAPIHGAEVGCLLMLALLFLKSWAHKSKTPTRVPKLEQLYLVKVHHPYKT